MARNHRKPESSSKRNVRTGKPTIVAESPAARLVTAEDSVTEPPTILQPETCAPDSVPVLQPEDCALQPPASQSEDHHLVGEVEGPVARGKANHLSSLSLLGADPQIPIQHFGAYELVWEISKDALSTTYAARRSGIDGLFAIRIFNSRTTDNAQVRTIQKAARKAAELTHLNLITVYDTGIGENGAPYVVTDWVESESLADVFQVTKKLDIGRFLNVFNQVCEALSEAHSRRLIHGNLSPNRIRLVHNDDDTDIVKVTDFGMPPDPVQNAFYLSPEQRLDAQKADESADIYSLGCIMYEALVGAPPHTGNQANQVALNYLHELANQYSPDSPEHNALKLLDCIIVKCLQKQRSKRFRNIRELMSALALVNDCITGGKTRKLPPKAEKLLLFRFLDLFDKKITAGLTAYLIVGCLSYMYIGEIQLQKYIDQAQLARGYNWPLAQSFWKKALWQGQAIGKPPSLLAQIHWDLADAYRACLAEPHSGTNANDIARDAIVHYQASLNYFNKGASNKSYALALLQNEIDLYTQMDDTDQRMACRESAVKAMQALLKRKDFKDAAKIGSEYLKQTTDSQIALYTAQAYTELGKSLPPAKALRNFERATYYAFLASGNCAGQTDEMDNLDGCITKLNMDSSFPETTAWLGSKALEAGDVEAARGEYLSSSDRSTIAEISNTIEQYFLDRQMAYRTLKSNPNVRLAIGPLERWMKTAEEAYGLHGKELAGNLAILADSYRSLGEKEKALSAYKRLFALEEPSAKTPAQIIAYADLLCETEHSGQARKLLEKEVISADGQVVPQNELLMRLVQVYAADKNSQQAKYLISKVVGTPAAATLSESSPPDESSSPAQTGDEFSDDPPRVVGLHAAQLRW